MSFNEIVCVINNSQLIIKIMLDIRIPIGLMFTVLGVMISIYGIITNSNAVMYNKSFGININIWSGLGMLLFGLIMLALTRIKKKV